MKMEYEQNSNDLIKSFNKIANIYDNETDDFSHKIVEYINMENIKQELPKPDKTLKLLDLGGGTGKYSLLLSKLGYNVTLVDISNESLKVAKEKFKQENISIPIINISGEELSFEDDYFDIIIMLGGVINYTPDYNKLLKECKRVLKQNGVLYFDFINNNGWCNETFDPRFRIEIAETNEKTIKMDDWDYPMRIFNYKYMEEVLERNGLKVRSKYGLINLSTSLPLDIRYGKEYDKEILERYKRLELKISREKECYGTSWSCSIIVIK
jgi:ubiquinone/menaquinone biosynthesis C-methylase UbiE